MDKTDRNERIKLLRKSRGLSQTEFADALGVSRNVIANYETGRAYIDESTIRNIARTFNVTEEWLRTGRTNLDMLSGTGLMQASDADSSEKIASLLKFFSELPMEDIQAVNRILDRYIKFSKDSRKDE